MKPLVKLTKSLFTFEDVKQENSNISSPDLSEYLNDSLKKGTLQFLGIQVKLNQPTQYVYAKTPVTEEIMELARYKGIKHKNKKTLLSLKVVEGDSHLTSKQKIFLQKVFTKNILREILHDTQKGIKKIIKIHDGGSRTALISDNYSTLLGTNVSKIIHKRFGYEVEISGTDNRKTDLYFPEFDIKVELKATARTSWSGGEYSKRPYPTILISYDIDNSEYFVSLVPKIDWRVSESENYYATTLSWKNFRDNYPEKVILFGSMGIIGSRGKTKQMIREVL